MSTINLSDRIAGLESNVQRVCDYVGLPYASIEGAMSWGLRFERAARASEGEAGPSEAVEASMRRDDEARDAAIRDTPAPTSATPTRAEWIDIVRCIFPRFMEPDGDAKVAGGLMEWIAPHLAARDREIDELRRDRDEADAAVAALEERDKWPRCACVLDSKDDVCMVHSPAVARAEKERDEARAKLADVKMERIPAFFAEKEGCIHFGPYMLSWDSSIKDGCTILLVESVKRASCVIAEGHGVTFREALLNLCQPAPQPTAQISDEELGGALRVVPFTGSSEEYSRRLGQAARMLLTPPPKPDAKDAK